MSNRNLILSFLALVVFLFAFSCKKSKDKPVRDLLAGKWTLDQTVADDSGRGVIIWGDSVLIFDTTLNTGTDPVIYDFQPNGILNISNGYGEWHWSLDDDRKLKLSWYNFSTEWNIEKLTSDELILETAVPGQSSVAEYTFKR